MEQLCRVAGLSYAFAQHGDQLGTAINEGKRFILLANVGSRLQTQEEGSQTKSDTLTKDCDIEKKASS